MYLSTAVIVPITGTHIHVHKYILLMKQLLGYNSLLSERKSKQQLNRRINVKTVFWPNREETVPEEGKEERLRSVEVKKDRRKKSPVFFFMPLYLCYSSQQMGDRCVIPGKEQFLAAMCSLRGCW